MQSISLAALGIKTGSGAFRLKFKECDFSLDSVLDKINEFESKLVNDNTTKPSTFAPSASKVPVKIVPNLSNTDIQSDKDNTIRNETITTTNSIAMDEQFYKPPPVGITQNSNIFNS